MPGFDRKFDRSKLKATSAATIQKQERELAQKRPSKKFDKSYHEIEVGENVFRFFPFHPDDNVPEEQLSFVQPKSVAFLEIEVPKRDEEGKIIEGKTEIKRKPIFNAKVHGGYKKDIVETYIDVATKIAIPNFTEDEEDKKKILSKINGNHITKEQGIKYTDSWVGYAAKLEGETWSKAKLVDLKTTIKDGMKSAALDLGNPDPWTDFDEGFAVCITKAEKAAKAADWYKVKVYSTMQKVAGVAVPIPIPVSVPLTDAQGEEWWELKPLHTLFVNSFKRKDLEYQIEGLQRLDEKLKADGFDINVFGYPEFQDVVNEMLDLVPEDKQSDDEKEESAQEEKTKKVETKKAVTTPLKSQATTNKPAPAKQVIKKQPEPEPEETQEEEAEEIEVKEQIEAPKTSTKTKLDEIRARMGKK